LPKPVGTDQRYRGNAINLVDHPAKLFFEIISGGTANVALVLTLTQAPRQHTRQLSVAGKPAAFAAPPVK
jgi:hypothetical protein